MQGRRGSELTRDRVPLAARSEDEQDSVEDATAIDPRPATELARSVARQQGLDPIPEFIRDSPRLMSLNLLRQCLTPRRGVRKLNASTTY